MGFTGYGLQELFQSNFFKFLNRVIVHSCEFIKIVIILIFQLFLAFEKGMFNNDQIHIFDLFCLSITTDPLSVEDKFQFLAFFLMTQRNFASSRTLKVINSDLTKNMGIVE
eukprot:TRINITY_DN3254_c5_g1_i1.p1 TRINITY_DN3254_c5_g1~~TRINITY_DN3254_c5_g1_i1.p1  ORF type:complete len:111 (-),score=15.25 TRINITY_DN3254_c5_g1_i1:280-612(-)